MSNVARIFDTKSEAQSVLVSLFQNGFSKDNVSLLVADSERGLFENNAPATQIANDSLEGATVAGTAGAILAGLAAVGAIAIPGVNLLAIGPITALLAGAGAGGLVGGLSGAINADQESEKEAYEQALKQGKVVLIVHAVNAEKQAKAKTILNSSTMAQRVA